MMGAGGRPTKMTPETIAKLEEGFTMGFSDVEACLYAGISKSALYNYCDEHVEFRDRKEELKNHPTLLAKRNVIESLREGDQQTSKWYLERKAPDFKAKQEIEASIKELPKAIELVAGPNITTT